MTLVSSFVLRFAAAVGFADIREYNTHEEHTRRAAIEHHHSRRRFILISAIFLGDFMPARATQAHIIPKCN